MALMPSVVARRIVEDLPDGPAVGALVDDQHSGAARVRPGADLVVHLEVAVQGVGPRVGIPAAVRVQRPQLVVVTATKPA